MSEQIRQPQGQPSGGQFAAQQRPDANIELAVPAKELPSKATRYLAADRPAGRYVGPKANNDDGPGFPTDGWQIAYVSRKSVYAIHPWFVGELGFDREDFELA